MDLQTVITNLMEGLALSQYEAYQYSLENSKDIDEGLFPIPYATLQEVTFNLKFAYLPGYSDDHHIEPTQTAKIWKHISADLETGAKQLQRLIAGRIKLTGDIDEQTFTDVKEGLKKGAMTPQALKHCKKTLEKAIPQLRTNEEGKFLLAASKWLVKSLMAVCMQHYQVGRVLKTQGEKIITQEDAKNTLADRATIELNEIIYSGMAITVNAGELKALPEQSIQELNLTMNVNNILNRNTSNHEN